MGYKCQYCGKVLTSKPNLYKHQRNTKYCLELQGKKSQPDAFICDNCGNGYKHYPSLARHKKQCQTVQPREDQFNRYEKLLLTISEMQNKQMDTMKEIQLKQIDTILGKMMDVLSSSNVVNSNNTRNIMLNNLSPITDEQLSEKIEHLTLNFIRKGAKGYADFAGHYPLKNNIVCTDKARKKIRYKDANGELTDDSKELTKRFFSAIQPKNEELINTEYQDLHEQIKSIVSENKAGELDITSLLTRATELQELLIKSREAARGKNDEFARDFIKHLTKNL